MIIFRKGDQKNEENIDNGIDVVFTSCLFIRARKCITKRRREYGCTRRKPASIRCFNGFLYWNYIEQYKDDEQIGEQIALFGEDFEQFLSLLQETTLIREPLPEERPVSKDYYYIIVDGDKDITTMFIEKENEEQLISLPANNIIPSGIRKATNDDILKYIKTIETAEE